MRIAYMSDLHREFHPSNNEIGTLPAGSPAHPPFALYGPDLSNLRGRCDALVVAGDLDVGDGSDALREAAAYLGVPVIYVTGNHEFYGSRIEKVMADLHARLPADGVHLLDRDEVVFQRGPDGKWRIVPEGGDGSRHSASGGTPAASSETNFVRLLGCMLWTDFGLFGDDNRQRCKLLAGNLINDYSRIAAGPVDAAGKLYRRLTPSDTHGLHIRDRNWLEERLGAPFAGRTVVVTHMAPSMRSVPERYRHDPLSAAFASDLEALIERTQPELWIHGHTHDSFDYRIGRTRVVCNPYGYYGHELNQAFREDLVGDISAGASLGAEAGPEGRPGGEEPRGARPKRDWSLE